MSDAANETPDRPHKAGFNLSQGFDWAEMCGCIGFDHDSLDTQEERLKELILRGSPIADAIEEIVMSSERVAARELLLVTLSIIADAEKPRLCVAQLAWVARLPINKNASMPELAKMFGISKQAFKQGADRIEAIIGHYLNPSVRSDSARDKMRRHAYKKNELTY